jgi:hypothetical protein
MWAFLILVGITAFFFILLSRASAKPDYRYKQNSTPPSRKTAFIEPKQDPRYAKTHRRGSLNTEDTYAKEPATPEMQFVVPDSENIEYSWRTGDFDTARRLLQKASYNMKRSYVTDRDRAEFTRLMTEFASQDPLYKTLIKPIRVLIELEPGLMQSDLSKQLTAAGADIETVRYVLYFAHELNHIHRVKHGRSYKLYLPGVTVDQDKTPPDIANN